VPTKVCWVMASFVKTGAVKAIRHQGRRTHLCSHSPNPPPSYPHKHIYCPIWSKFWFKKSVRYAAENFSVATLDGGGPNYLQCTFNIRLRGSQSPFSHGTLCPAGNLTTFSRLSSLIASSRELKFYENGLLFQLLVNWGWIVSEMHVMVQGTRNVTGKEMELLEEWEAQGLQDLWTLAFS